MADKGFVTESCKQVLEGDFDKNAKDLRDKLWISIDPEGARDLDQVTYAEDDRLYIATSDVDSFVRKNDEIDEIALHNSTTVYTPTIVFPMIPKKLSFDLTSLIENKDRYALVIEVKMANHHFELAGIYSAWVCNKAMLSYEQAASWLEHSIPKKPVRREIIEQLEKQNVLAQRWQKYRLSITDLEVIPSIVQGIPVDFEEKTKTKAHFLIENCMFIANLAATQYLQNKNTVFLHRVVKSPKNWDRIVQIAKELGEILPNEPDAKELHRFLLVRQQIAPLEQPDLCIVVNKLLGQKTYVVGESEEYFDPTEQVHATAPNRRFSDLIVQRLIKGNNKYSIDELQQIADHCTLQEKAARKIERKMLKCAFAMLLKDRIGEVFSAMVTGASEKGTWIRLTNPAIEGKLVQGETGMQVGDFLKAELVFVDPEKGFIDFAKVTLQ